MRYFKILTISLLAPILLFSESNLSFQGFYKNFFVVFQQPNPEFSELLGLSNKTWLGMVNQRLRLQSLYLPSARLSFEFAYDISARIQEPELYGTTLFKQTIDPRIYRIDDLKRRPYVNTEENSSFGLLQNLDRALITLSPDFADIYVGRQAIAWGSARVVNPTDIIAPFTFDELDQEERLGVDAVRMRVPIGFMGAFDAGYVFGKDFKVDHSAFFLRSKFYLAKTDVSILSVGFQRNLLVGLDISRAIGGAGFWFESAYVWPKVFGDKQDNVDDNYLRASIGADYSLTDKMYGFVEYHFNQAGALEPKDYLSNLSQVAYTEGAVYLMARHYVAPGIQYQITPLFTGLATVLFNMTDQSAYIAPTFEYNFAENVYVSLGGFLGFGESINNFQVGSEFGLYPHTLFSSFRIYF